MILTTTPKYETLEHKTNSALLALSGWAFEGFVLRGGEGGKITLCLKLVRTMLETSNLTHPYVVSENIPFSAETP